MEAAEIVRVGTRVFVTLLYLIAAMYAFRTSCTTNLYGRRVSLRFAAVVAFGWAMYWANIAYYGGHAAWLGPTWFAIVSRSLHMLTAVAIVFNAWVVSYSIKAGKR